MRGWRSANACPAFDLLWRASITGATKAACRHRHRAAAAFSL